MNVIAGAKQASQRPLRLRVDVWLLLTVVTLVVFGLLMVFSSSVDASIRISGSPTYMITRQVLWVVLGAVLAAVLALVDYHRLEKLAVPAIAAVLVMLIAVLLFGETRFNATRSLLNGSIQPSEAAKLVTVLYLAVWMYKKQAMISDIWYGLLPLGGILGIIGVAILLQPDISATFTIIILGGLLFFLAGVELRQVGILLGIALVVGALVIVIFPTGQARLAGYLDGLRNPVEATYHVRRSLEAVVQGGWFGVGIGNSKTKFIGLPVPSTDSIFAVIAEETGILGSMVVVALYMVLLWRGLKIARRAPDLLGMLLASGLTLWLVFEAVVNMTVIVGLMPIAGNALPFISAGGSSMVTSLAAVGILISVARQAETHEAREGRSFGAVVDLRRRDRGRRVSRPYRPAGTQE